MYFRMLPNSCSSAAALGPMMTTNLEHFGQYCLACQDPHVAGDIVFEWLCGHGGHVTCLARMLIAHGMDASTGVPCPLCHTPWLPVDETHFNYLLLEVGLDSLYSLAYSEQRRGYNSGYPPTDRPAAGAAPGAGPIAGHVVIFESGGSRSRLDSSKVVDFQSGGSHDCAQKDPSKKSLKSKKRKNEDPSCP